MEKLISLFENNNDITLILNRDLAFDLIELLEMKGHRFCEEYSLADVKELYDSNVLRVSRFESFGQEECYFEVTYGYEHLKYVDSWTIAIIEEGVIEPWEIEEYVKGGYVLFDFSEEDEECNETDEFIDETMEDLLSELDSLNGNKCAYNIIKGYLLDMYETGYQGGIIDSIEQLEVNLKESYK